MNGQPRPVSSTCYASFIIVGLTIIGGKPDLKRYRLLSADFLRIRSSLDAYWVVSGFSIIKLTLIKNVLGKNS
jgi:hypothetical protein